MTPELYIGIAGLVSTIAMAWVARGQQKNDGYSQKQQDHERRITVLETEQKGLAAQLAEVKQIVNKIDDKMDTLVEKQSAVADKGSNQARS